MYLYLEGNTLVTLTYICHLLLPNQSLTRGTSFFLTKNVDWAMVDDIGRPMTRGTFRNGGWKYNIKLCNSTFVFS